MLGMVGGALSLFVYCFVWMHIHTQPKIVRKYAYNMFKVLLHFCCFQSSFHFLYLNFGLLSTQHSVERVNRFVKNATKWVKYFQCCHACFSLSKPVHFVFGCFWFFIFFFLFFIFTKNFIILTKHVSEFAIRIHDCFLQTSQYYYRFFLFFSAFFFYCRFAWILLLA